MRQVDEIIDKIKEIKGFRNDLQLAGHLKLHPSTVGNWRLRKNIPADVLLSFCQENDIDPIWLSEGKASRGYPGIDNQEVYSILDIPNVREQLKKVQDLIRERDEARKKLQAFAPWKAFPQNLT